MARVLVTVHLGRHFRIFGHYDYKVLLCMGHEVHIAANFKDDLDRFDDPNVIKHQIDFERKPFSLGNYRAMIQLEKLLTEIHFDLIHTQSPSGGAVTRLAARKTREKGTKVIYTAHGFHFFRGASAKNWLIFYNIEKWLGRFTDTIITINDEDYMAAQEKLPVKDVKHINGVGIDLNKYKPQSAESKAHLRKQYGYKDDELLLIYAGELSYRKHQDLVIDAIYLLKNKILNIKLLLAGAGELCEQYKEQVNRLGLEGKVEFLGYRKDIVNLMMLSDIAVSSSRQEGLPVNIMEAMATGLPVVVTDCRGNRDLASNGKNGYIVGINDIGGFAKSIESLYLSQKLRRKYGQESIDLIQQYSIEKVKVEMQKIYSSVFENGDYLGLGSYENKNK